jgi:hypothetical protein
MTNQVPPIRFLGDKKGRQVEAEGVDKGVDIIKQL